MKNDFTSYFIAIPLPDPYLGLFGKLLKNIKDNNPEIATADPQTPHITIFYLDKSVVDKLEMVKGYLNQIICDLPARNIEIGGYNSFENQNNSILFLDVKKDLTLNYLHDRLSEKLGSYAAEDETNDFHPHITLARGKNLPNTEGFKTVKLNFDLDEIAVYGANSKQTPELQTKLASIRFQNV